MDWMKVIGSVFAVIILGLLLAHADSFNKITTSVNGTIGQLEKAGGA